MEETEMELANANEKGIVGKMKDWVFKNWQTVLVVLIVLMVGASAYNYNQQNNGNKQSSPIVTEEGENSKNNQESIEENKIAQNNVENSEAAAEKTDQENAAKEDKKAAVANNGTENNTKEENKNKNKNDKEENKETIITSSTDSGKTYKVKAARGEGITHLARRVIEKYLQETGEGTDLTPEHKVYIEDYIQNRTGSYKINIGHEETFQESLIKDAVSNAQKLSPSMLKSLEKYTKTP